MTREQAWQEAMAASMAVAEGFRGLHARIRIEAMQRFASEESTRPESIILGINDTPELFRKWCDYVEARTALGHQPLLDLDPLIDLASRDELLVEAANLHLEKPLHKWPQAVAGGLPSVAVPMFVPWGMVKIKWGRVQDIVQNNPGLCRVVGIERIKDPYSDAGGTMLVGVVWELAEYVRQYAPFVLVQS